ncbi:MAG: hypothetical protein WCC52_01055 [Nitrosotalea sp.]
MNVPPFSFGPVFSEIFTVTQISIIVISILLMILSITIYRNKKLKRIAFAIAIFAIFAVQHIINYIDAKVVDIMPDDMRYALYSSMTLVIIILFFLVIIKK